LIAKALMHVLVCGRRLSAALICALFLPVTALQFVLMLLVPLVFTFFRAVRRRDQPAFPEV
jgi:hypothetical protein